jgi:hypothetical protein
MRSTLVFLFGLFACRDAPAPAPSTHTPDRPDQTIGGTVVPQSHDFPAGRAAEIRRIFEGNALSYPIAVVSKEGAQTQFVNPRPVFIGDRRFVVGLPPASHAALDKLIAGLGTGPSPVGATYELTFWLVEAAVASETQVAPDLGEVAPMLQKLTALGKRKFKSLDRIGGRSRDGANTKLVGRMLQAEPRLLAGPDGIELELTLQVQGTFSDKSGGAVVETTLHLPLDQPIVIGDAAAPALSDTAANLFLYVVRARRVD